MKLFILLALLLSIVRGEPQRFLDGVCNSGITSVFFSGFEEPQVPTDLTSLKQMPNGWHAAKNPEVGRSGHKSISALEGSQVVILDSEVKEIYTDIDVSEVAYVYISLRFLAVDEYAAVQVLMGPIGEEKELFMETSATKGKWAEVRTEYCTSSRRTLRLKIKNPVEEAVALDVVNVTGVRIERKVDMPKLVREGDIFVITTSVKNTGFPGSPSMMLSEGLRGLQCVPHIDIVSGQAVKEERPALCHGSKALSPKTSLSCQEEYVVKHAVQAKAAGTSGVTPHLTILSDSEINLEWPEQLITVVEKDPLPDPTNDALAINGGFERPRLLGVDSANVIEVPGWWFTKYRNVSIWKSGVEGVEAAEGLQFAKLNPGGTISQNVKVTPGSKLSWSFRHRGLKNATKVTLNIWPQGGSKEKHYTADSSSDEWTTLSDVYTADDDLNAIRIVLFDIVASKSEALLLDDFKVEVKGTLPNVTTFSTKKTRPKVTTTSTSKHTFPMSTSFKRCDGAGKVFASGFENPVLPEGEMSRDLVPEGWEAKGVEVWRSGNNGIEAVEGRQMARFWGGGEISRDVELKGEDFLSYTFSFLSRHKVTASVEAMLWRSDRDQITNEHTTEQENKWVKVFGNFSTANMEGNRLFKLRVNPGNNILIDDVRLWTIKDMRRLEADAKMTEGDFYAITSSVKNVEFKGPITIEIRDSLSNLRCVPRSLKVLASPEPIEPSRFDCSSVVTPPDTSLDCGEEYKVRYAVQVRGNGTAKVVPTISVGTEVTSSYSWPIHSIDIEPKSPPKPTETEPLVNGGFERTQLHGLEAVDVSDSEYFGWRFPSEEVALWKSGKEGIEAAEGTQFVKLNRGEMVSQLLRLPPGTQFSWSLKHRGFKDSAKVSVNIGRRGLFMKHYPTVSSSNKWSEFSGTYTVPDDHATAFEIEDLVDSDSELLLDDIKIGLVHSDETNIHECHCDCCN